MITIVSSPSLYSPVYNPIYTEVSSTLTTQEAFSFLFDVYVNGVYVNRDRLLPRPGTTNAIYSPARVLESYVSQDLTHNLIGEIASVNCIDKYDIKIGEEYVKYWGFYDTQFDGFSFSSYTVLAGTSSDPHTFLVNDYVVVSDTVYGTFNGVHKVVHIPNNYTVVVNKSFVSTPMNPGKATWSDKRKSEYFTATQSGYDFNGVIQYEEVPVYDYKDYAIDRTSEMIYNGGFTSSLGGWGNTSSNYGGAYSTFSIVTNQAVFNAEFDASDLSLINTSSSFVSGVEYTFNLTVVTASSPYNNLDASVWIGTSKYSLTPTQIYTPGIYNFNIVAGGTQCKISVGTDGQGGSLTLDNITAVASGYGRFLTNQPYTVKTKYTDRGSIGWLNIKNHNTTPNRAYYLRITGYVGSVANTPVLLNLTILSSNSVSTNRMINEYGIYPYNLNKQSQIEIASDVVNPTDTSYTIQVCYEEKVTAPGIYINVSEIKRFEIDTICSKYEGVRFMFLNSLGQFDFFNATLLSRTNVAVSRDTYVKTLSRGYSQGDRGKTTINVNAQEKTTINTDWVSEETAHWLTYEFVTSEEIYVLDSDTGKITPIILDVTDWEDKKRVNDKLLNYTISYSKAVTINTKRN